MPAQTATVVVWYLLLDTHGEAVAESSLDALEVVASETVLEFRQRVYEANAAILGGFVAAQLSVFRGADEFGLGTSAALTAKVVELKSCDARPLLVAVKAATEKHPILVQLRERRSFHTPTDMQPQSTTQTAPSTASSASPTHCVSDVLSVTGETVPTLKPTLVCEVSATTANTQPPSVSLETSITRQKTLKASPEEVGPQQITKHLFSNTEMPLQFHETNISALNSSNQSEVMDPKGGIAVKQTFETRNDTLSSAYKLLLTAFQSYKAKSLSEDALSLYVSGIQDVAKIGYPRFSAFLYDAACLGLVTRVYEPSTKELMISLEDNASAILSQWERGVQSQADNSNESEWRKVGSKNAVSGQVGSTGRMVPTSFSSSTKTEATIKERKSKGNPSSAAASIKSAKGPTAKNAEKNTATNYRPFSSSAPTVFQHVELAMRIAGGMPTRASVLETIVDPKVWRSYGSFKLYLQAAESAKVVDLNFDKPKDILVSLPAEVFTPIVLSENVNESMPVSDSGTRLPLFTKIAVSAEDEKTSVETIRSLDPVDVAPEFVPSKVASSSVTIAPACEISEDAASVTLPNNVLNDEDVEFDEWGLPLPAFDQGVNSNETLTAKYPQEYETVPAFIQQNILPPTLPYSASYTSISYTQPIYRPMVATAPQFSQHEPQAQWVFPVSKSITIRSPYDQNVIPLPQREVNDDKPPIWRAPASKAVQIQNPKTRAIVTVSATGSVVESTNHSLNPGAGVFVLEDDFVELEDERILPSEVKVSNKTFNAALIGSDKLCVEQSINELRNNEERNVDEMSTPISEEMASISMDTVMVDQEYKFPCEPGRVKNVDSGVFPECSSEVKRLDDNASNSTSPFGIAISSSFADSNVDIASLTRPYVNDEVASKNESTPSQKMVPMDSFPTLTSADLRFSSNSTFSPVANINKSLKTGDASVLLSFKNDAEFLAQSGMSVLLQDTSNDVSMSDGDE